MSGHISVMAKQVVLWSDKFKIMLATKIIFIPEVAHVHQSEKKNLAAKC